jgi:hypothetical protein
MRAAIVAFLMGMAAVSAQAQVLTGGSGDPELTALEAGLNDILQLLEQTRDVNQDDINRITSRIEELQTQIENLRTTVDGGLYCRGTPQCP